VTVPIDWGLEGKVAIVAGGGSVGEGIGNGRAASILLARAGASVLVVDHDLASAEQTAAMIDAEGGTAAAARYDVTSETACQAMVDEAVSRWGRLDCLNNNVGTANFATVLDETPENWARIMQVNVGSMFLACKYAIPAMIRGGGGSIVNISSLAALRPHGLAAYSTSKGAVHALTHTMAVDHGRAGIRANCVVPGPMHTPAVYARGMSEEVRERRRNASALKREGTGWDIGAAVCFLLSDLARYVTGQILVVDGGTSLMSPERDL
jgi:NAD(P)-dependent dehydrogenase (short-subunit alcohol dehydrogenase family)